MTQEQYNKSIDTGELQLIFWNKVSHFGIVGFCFFITLVLLAIPLTNYLEGNAAFFAEGELYIITIPIILGVLFYWLQKNRLKFQFIKTSLNEETVKKLIEQFCKEWDWTLCCQSAKIFIAKTNPSVFSGSWGEQITILIDGNNILVNSICDPNKKQSLVSMGRNRENTQALKAMFNKAGQ